MKKSLFIATLLAVSASFLMAQTQTNDQSAQPKAATAEVGSPQADKIGVDTAQQKLKTVSVNKFEDAGFWSSNISSDEGIIQTRQFTGGPTAKADEKIADERYVGTDPQTSDKYVIGTRVDFFKRGYNSFMVYPSRPIPIEGIVKTVSVWVVGRNYNHTLKLMLQDAFGTNFEITMGTLNFQGWKKLEVPVPPQAPDGDHGIIQKNYHYINRAGVKITGFKIECDPMEAYGSYYIYFDDLRAVTDLFAEDNRDADDLPDNW
jgi:hypothetical protein